MTLSRIPETWSFEWNGAIRPGDPLDSMSTINISGVHWYDERSSDWVAIIPGTDCEGRDPDYSTNAVVKVIAEFFSSL